MTLIDVIFPLLLGFELIEIIMSFRGVVIRTFVLHPTFTPETKSSARGLLLIVYIEDMSFKSLQVLQFSRTSLPLTYEGDKYRLRDWNIKLCSYLEGSSSFLGYAICRV